MRRELSESVVDEIAGAESSDGVISVYVAPDHPDSGRARIELKNALAAAQAADGHAAGGQAFEDALEIARVGAEDALSRGYAVAGFVPVGAPEEDAVWIDLPAAAGLTTIVVDTDTHVLPLLALVELFGTSGVVTVARDRLAVHEWADGRLEELEHRAVDVDTSTWRATDGPFNAAAAGRGGGDASGAQSTIGSGDAHAEKLEAAMVAELAGVASPLIARHVDARGWARVLWFGDPAVIRAVATATDEQRVTHVVADAAQLIDAPPGDLAARAREASEARWFEDSAAAMAALAERHPTERAEDLAQALELAREGRVDELFVAAYDALGDDDLRRRVNTLAGEVARRGGRVRALGGEAAADLPATGVVATLRW